MAQSSVADVGHDLSVLGLFKHADPVVQSIMVGLVLASIVCWGIIFEKFIRLRKLSADVKALETGARNGDFSGHSENGMAGTLDVAARTEADEGGSRHEDRNELRARVERAMRGAMRTELKRLEVGLPFLATVGSASPFVGLFGTVWGIMHSFTAIAQQKDTSLAVVAPGIAEALFATALGLAAAIPAVIAYNQIAVSLGRYSDRIGAVIGVLARRMSGVVSEPARLKSAGE